MHNLSVKKYIVLLFTLWNFGLFGQNRTLDSLRLALNKFGADTNRVNNYNRLSKGMAQIAQYDSAESYAGKSEILAGQLNFKTGKRHAITCMGTAKMNRGNYPEAMKYFIRGLELARETGNKLIIASANTNIASVLVYQSKYTEALEIALECLKIYLEAGDKNKIANSYGHLGGIYLYQKNYKKAKEIVLKQLVIVEELKDKRRVATAYGNLALVNWYMSDLQEAIQHNRMAIKLKTEVNDRSGLASAYLTGGNIYADQKNYEEAIRNFERAQKINTEIGNLDGVAAGNINMATVYLARGKSSKAIELCKKGLEMALRSGRKEWEQNAHQVLSKAYAKDGNDKLALASYKSFIACKDSLLNEENTKKTVRLEMNYEFEKKEASSKLEREKKEAVAIAESKKQKIIIYSVSGILILVVGFAIFAYRSYRQKQKANLEITKQKHIIEEKQREIMDSIHYAKRIQTALITNEHFIGKTLHKLTSEL